MGGAAGHATARSDPVAQAGGERKKEREKEDGAHEARTGAAASKRPLFSWLPVIFEGAAAAATAAHTHTPPPLPPPPPPLAHRVARASIITSPTVPLLERKAGGRVDSSALPPHARCPNAPTPQREPKTAAAAARRGPDSTRALCTEQAPDLARRACDRVNKACARARSRAQDRRHTKESRAATGRRRRRRRGERQRPAHAQKVWGRGGSSAKSRHTEGERYI